jgi:hypothetical protein
MRDALRPDQDESLATGWLQASEAAQSVVALR